jgi:hypothetical protein
MSTMTAARLLPGPAGSIVFVEEIFNDEVVAAFLDPGPGKQAVSAGKETGP